MASLRGLGQSPRSSNICNTCLTVDWTRLPAEDAGAVLHHRSRRDLEFSAVNCRICAMILRSALANYRASIFKRASWREFTQISVHDGTRISDAIYIRELGLHQPVFHNETPIVMAGTGHGMKLVKDFVGGLNKNGLSVFAFTSSAADKESGNKAEDLAVAVDRLRLEEENIPEDHLVWIYGNYWAEYTDEPRDKTSSLKLVLMGAGARFGTSQSILHAAGAQPGQLDVRGGSIRLRTEDNCSISDYIPSRIAEKDSNSELAQRRLDTWLRNCEANHPHCRLPNEESLKFPTRVIDVLASERTVKLVKGTECQGRYVALSHTWGKTARLVTTYQNLEDLETGIAISFLPKTFQDAIRITRRLKIRYLWIDCLCIIQDPKEWEREAAAMTEVYRNAHITISASASSDSYSGCLPNRSGAAHPSIAAQSLGREDGRAESSANNDLTLTLGTSPTQGNSIQLHFSEEWLPGSSCFRPQDVRIGAFGRPVDPIASEPLSTRGWTLQERLLSRRIIHFATDQMYFECEQELVSECGFKIANRQFSMRNCIAAELSRGPPERKGVSFIVGQHAEDDNSPRRKYGWTSLVENYSRRQLTDPQDKMTAIAGVARLLAQATGDHYLGGLWYNYLEEDLFWRIQTHEESIERGEGDGIVLSPKTGALIGSASRPAQYRAPSWSWASMDGPVKFIPLSHKLLVCRPRLCFNTPSGSDDYGRLKDGLLDIDAPVFEIKPYKPEKPWERHGMPALVDFGDERGEVHGSVFLDLPGESLPSPCYALFLDPANAIIIKSKNMRPGPNSDQPEAILSTSSLDPSMRKTKPGTRIIWLRGGRFTQVDEATYSRLVSQMQVQSSLVTESNTVVRIGIGQFSKEHDYGAKASDKSPDVSSKDSVIATTAEGQKTEINFDDILHVSADESWGVVTKEDAWVPVSIR